MTRDIAGFISPTVPPHLRSREDFARLPDNAPAILVKDSIVVDGPSTTWPYGSSLDRQQRFQNLVNRFYVQIRYGCKEPQCQTPTCLSYRKRSLRGPYRRFTVLSARTLASFLAGSDNPEQHLCLHEPNRARRPLDWSSLRKQARQLQDPTESHSWPTNSSPNKAGSETESRDGDVCRQEKVPIRANSHAMGSGKGSNKNIEWMRVEHEPKQTTKDPKSFTQNLFDTAALTLFHLLPARDLHAWWNSGAETEPQKSSTDTSDTLNGVSQLLSHFTLENVDALVSFIEPHQLDDSSFDEERRLCQAFGQTPNLYAKAQEDNRNDRAEKFRRYTFGVGSINYIFSSPRAILKSFIHSPSASVSHSDMKLAVAKLRSIDIHQSIFPCLWVSLSDVFPVSVSHSTHDGHRPQLEPNPLSDTEAAHIMKVALAALVASVPSCLRSTWEVVRAHHSWGLLAPQKHVRAEQSFQLLSLLDAYEDEMALDLIKRFLRAFSARRCLSEIRKIQENSHTEPLECTSPLLNFKDALLQFFIPDDPSGTRNTQITNSIAFPSIALEWVRTAVLKCWDGNAELPTSSTVGGALDFASCLYKRRIDFGLTSEDFEMRFLFDRLDHNEMPVEWLSWQKNEKTVHLLSYPFLFPPGALVIYFRAINYTAMLKVYENSGVTHRMVNRMSKIAGSGRSALFTRLHTAMTNFLILDIRRDDILKDALDQLWRRERRELMRPLRVRLGMDEGEEGVDHGGVQQEFFRLAIGDALKPVYGLFTTDSRTRMSWFQSCSLEPVYKFELLGLLTSLAVYNGLTLPVTFPLALYRKLLDLPVTELSHIQDGWPDLAKGLKGLLTWSQSDVEETFMRSYEFSIEVPGSTIFVDMERTGKDDVWPLESLENHKRSTQSTPDFHEILTPVTSPLHLPSLSLGSEGSFTVAQSAGSSRRSSTIDSQTDLRHPSLRSRSNSVTSPANMVNNANREQFVRDYIFWLTDKSIRPQYEAFARGFYVCLDKKAVSIFNPEALQKVVEGYQYVDVEGLAKATKYENGYSTDDRVIKDFWHVVRRFSQKQVKQLLEFVTASDRVPVGGIDTIGFFIQRNGADDERLPTSMTCFGRLLLPEYSSRAILQRKLLAAIDHSQGFGMA